MKRKKEKRPWCWAALAAAALLTVLALAVLPGNGPGGETVACLSAGESRYLVPVGHTVGIKLFSRGVMVVALSDVTTREGSSSPARDCGLKTGDIITSINGQQVNSIEEVQSAVQDSGGSLDIQASRSGRELSLTAQAAACLADGSYRLGAWVRDSMAGIGTVTFYDPETGVFAALGHGINDVDTGLLMPLQSGAVMPSVVSGLIRGEQGIPGELHGSFDLTQDLGQLTANTDWGVFGIAGEGCFDGEAVEVAAAREVRTGAAAILANVEGDTVEEYAVEILRVYPSGGDQHRSLLLQVTDQRLLDATGGIVQGMSGSPILQNGKLVGAVTHVLVNDPTRGYGILIEDMLEAAG
ncbi:MAG: SpoIVB peptidase [Clostridiales bacterium]|nr:SpoIVB peptidase [Clostridiales bacterium]